MSGYEPPYDPDQYNKDPKIQNLFNCFDYALRVVDHEKADICRLNDKDSRCSFDQPGGTKGLSNLLRQARGRSCKTVEYLLKQDIPDIIKTDFYSKCPVGTSKIAMRVDPGEDYHFYSHDKDEEDPENNGTWSHKDGGNKVKRFDADGQPIVNPQTAASDYRQNGSFLNYEDFCGFYCVPRNRKIRLAQGGRFKRPMQNTRRRRRRSQGGRLKRPMQNTRRRRRRSQGGRSRHKRHTRHTRHTRRL